ncbi:LCP family protein [Amycolatopsis pithecellobii]|uniref:LCP family protein n=1 Tax=Amycolatopsis pithecellobii TaxID=664692 RepID=UPI0028AB90EB|nr:LCP family protein [Amycolatopsis pithecellobii]
MTDGVTTRQDAAEELSWPPPPIPSPRRRKRAFVLFALRSGKVIIAFASVAVLLASWYGWQFIGDPNSGLATSQVFEDNELHAVPLDGAVDILLVGMDSRTDAQGNPLPREVLDLLHAGDADGEKQTDTMILVHIPQDGRQAVAISFPRDSWVEFTGGYGRHKLNGAFVYAYNDRFEQLQRQGVSAAEADRQAKIAGRKNLVATLEKFMGKPGMIDRYAEVNLASFYEVTKALGGVEVCLNGPVHERKSGVDLPAGRQTVEGVQALAFVRQRYDLPNGDLDRIARQQAFLSGLARKVLSPDLLANPAELGGVINAVKKSVVLSDNWDLVQFAAQMRGLDSGSVRFQTIPVVGPATIGGADVLRVDPAQVQEFVTALTTDGTTESLAPTTTTPAPSSTKTPPSSAKRSSTTSASTSSAPPSSVTPPITGGEVACVN